MARPLRIQFEGAVYHITSRGNAGQEVFLDDKDRAAFLEVLAEVVGRFGWICHAYCLMSNHYHLLVETPLPNLSKGMQLLNGVYTQRFNRYHKRFGHVLQGRYKAILVERESHLLELARYVVLNPVRARMVRSAKDWPWSSYRATSGQSQVPEFLHIDWILSNFDSRRDRAVSAYRRFVRQGKGIDPWDGLRAGSLLGSESFVERMRPLLLDAPLDQNVLQRERDATRPSLEDIFQDVASKQDRDARIYVAVRVHHYKLQEVGDHLGLHFSTISAIAKHQASGSRK
jgi:REP element-mobilizing transposase RayT